MQEREVRERKDAAQHVVSSAVPAPRVQAKLAVGRADDPQEAEADRLAAEVMRLIQRGIEPALEDDADPGPRVRRAVGASGAGVGGSVGGDRLGGTTAVADVESRIRSHRGRGNPLDVATAQSLGAAFGSDFSAVRVHTDNDADQLSRELDARAFTVGSDIFFRSDERASARGPNSLLAHELTHVVQQQAGAVQRDVARRVNAPADLGAAATAKANADKAQEDARKQLLEWVKEGAKSGPDRRLRNSCEMVLQGKVKLYALTVTGDSNARVTANGDDPADTAAWFPDNRLGGAGDLLTGASSYNHADLDDNANVKFDDLTTEGAAGNGRIAIYKVAAKTKAYVFETLRHEVQHLSDHSDDKKAAASAAGDDGKFKLERYKTEYRAYSYEGSDNDNYSPTKKVNAEGLVWTERQRHIFEHIRDGYAHTEEGWDDNPIIDGKTFREHVVAYVDPDSEGFNKYNSPKVEEVYQAVKACADNERDINAATVKEVMKKIAALPREDAIAMSKENPDWRKLVEKKFGMIVRNQILNKIQQQAQ
jgi:hypothetical protein